MELTVVKVQQSKTTGNFFYKLAIIKSSNDQFVVENKQTFYLAGAKKQIPEGSIVSISMDTYKVVEEPFVIPAGDSKGKQIMLKKLYLK